MGSRGFSCSRVLALLLSALAVSASAALRGPGSDAVRVLRKVHQALDEGKLERSLDQLTRLDRETLADHAAWIRARVLRQLGRSDVAIEAARAGLQLDPPRELVSLLFEEIARVEIDRG